jgi:hypothetical protein
MVRGRAMLPAPVTIHAPSCGDAEVQPAKPIFTCVLYFKNSGPRLHELRKAVHSFANARVVQCNVVLAG